VSDGPYSPSHRQAGAQVINIQSTLRTAPDLWKNISLAVLFGSSGNSYAVRHVCVCVCVCVYVCIFIYIVHNIKEPIGQKKRNTGTAVNAASQGNLPECHSGHLCQRFASPDVKLPRGISMQLLSKTVYSFSTLLLVSHAPPSKSPSVDCTIPSDEEHKSRSYTLGTCNCLQSFVNLSIFIHFWSRYSL
jgi:hypothetical protein